MQELRFDYFRGMEAEQYSFYRIPKALFTAECFQSLSCEAKVLYGLMLDRMGLSIKNRWFDEENRVYIIFTVEEIMEMMNCKTQKATKLLKELDTENGIGLIEKKRQGLGKPNVIYVKNFIIKNTIQSAEIGENRADKQNCDNQKTGISEIENHDFPESKFQNCENQKSRISETKNQDFPESKSQNGGNQNPEILKSTIQEFPKSQSIKTDIIKTERNETDPIISNHFNRASEASAETETVIGLMDRYRETVRGNISYYECYADASSYERKNVDELVELVVEVLMQQEGQVKVAGEDKPVAVVKSRFMKLRQPHIEYVLFCLNRNTSKVANIKSYLLTVLYNAPVTINNFYQAEVNHDLYGG